MKYEVSKIKLQLIKENTQLFDKQLTKVENVIQFLKNIVELHKESEEVLIVVTCDTKLNVTGYFEVSRGALNSAIASPREIFKRIILNNSFGFMLAHNHPSGNATPSLEDYEVYETIKKASELLDIKFFDNLIITDKENYSFEAGNIVQYGGNDND